MGIESTIDSIVEGKEEFGQYELIDRNDLYKNYESPEEKCDANNQAVETFCFYAKEAKRTHDTEEHTRRANSAHRILEQIHGKDEYNLQVKQGVLGEVALALALKEAGFRTLRPDVEEDSRYKIDLWADSRDGKILAIQCKTSAHISDIEVIDLRNIQNIRSLGIWEPFRHNLEKMVKYVNSKKEEDSDNEEVFPLLIAIPGGEGNIESMYNYTTGLPIKEMPDILYDKLAKIIYKEEEY